MIIILSYFITPLDFFHRAHLYVSDTVYDLARILKVHDNSVVKIFLVRSTRPKSFSHVRSTSQQDR